MEEREVMRELLPSGPYHRVFLLPCAPGVRSIQFFGAVTDCDKFHVVNAGSFVCGFRIRVVMYAAKLQSGSLLEDRTCAEPF